MYTWHGHKIETHDRLFVSYIYTGYIYPIMWYSRVVSHNAPHCNPNVYIDWFVQETHNSNIVILQMGCYDSTCVFRLTSITLRSLELFIWKAQINNSDP